MSADTLISYHHHIGVFLLYLVTFFILQPPLLFCQLQHTTDDCLRTVYFWLLL